MKYFALSFLLLLSFSALVLMSLAHFSPEAPALVLHHAPRALRVLVRWTMYLP